MEYRTDPNGIARAGVAGTLIEDTTRTKPDNRAPVSRVDPYASGCHQKLARANRGQLARSPSKELSRTMPILPPSVESGIQRTGAVGAGRWGSDETIARHAIAFSVETMKERRKLVPPQALGESR